MSIIRYFIILFIFLTFNNQTIAEEVKKIGKFKDWETIIIKRMKKASRIMVTAYNKSGSQTIDHYSLMGFTKAYNAAKKSCT